MKKTILIFGAAGALGNRIIEEFKDDFLILCDLKEINLKKPNMHYISCDVSKEEDMKNVRTYIELTGRKIDVLIYAAGFFSRGTVEELDLAKWNRSFDVNVTGLFLALHEILRFMNEGGRIIAVASQFGIVGAYESAAYCASKAAMINLIKNVALDYGAKKICANCVCPGFFESDFYHGIQKEVKKKREWMTVTGMLPKSKVDINDVVQTIVLLSNNNSITGQCIVVDGGYTAR